MSRAKEIAKKNSLRIRRKRRVRGKITGTSEKPRVTIYKSNKYLSAQAINDVDGVTLASVNSKTLDLRVSRENAVKVAAEFAGKLKAAEIDTVVFDRNGYLYHGVIASFAQGLRDNGINL